MTDTQIFDRVAIIGIGLIGSSVAQAIRANGLAGHVACHDADADVRARAAALDIVDSMHDDLAGAVTDADMVVVATPVGVCGDVAAAMRAHLKPGSIVTDVGSVKGSVITAMSPHIPAGVHLVPGHPVAGTEHSGPESGFAELFQNRFSILTPPPGADSEAVSTLERLWRGMGADVEIMDAEHHDRVLAITSHLPHLIAYTIVATAADLETELEAQPQDDEVVTTREVIKYSAGGFRDFTRIAASDPVMWRDVFLLNKDAVLEMLGRFTEDLTALQRAIRKDDGDALFEMFTRTRDIRRGVIEARQAGRFQYTENGKSSDDDA
ncbi:MAG: prephenate/arogenate dehydrogenase family protein [Rhodospirillaceae bacterium]|jgi:cyclohexadieny/prephenate dehydrogenase|nr:prephenate/arogenate dehydrogenase family protein [Rhodospirillaceae bacterium]MBT6403870.1 prephenate/arogenate dehydrogenase family protein [Rhodospirillaceae bacterium]MBT6537646.1 prephenate/arogenate dehydrogenase family protein [Rhodospirillaceae bacterium]MBT7363063.1 prephenate/arogenate dehydrogenase family protein [Rhodospirillaceae bacterium]